MHKLIISPFKFRAKGNLLGFQGGTVFLEDSYT